MDRIMDLSRIWKAAWDVFPYFDRITNWDDAYREFLPHTASAKPGKELSLIYAAFMARLGDGHTMFGYPWSLVEEFGQLPFDLLYAQEGYILSAAPAGWEQHLYQKVLAINGQPFEHWIARVCHYAYHVGDYVGGYGLRRTLPLLLEKHNQLETTAGRIDFSLATAAVEKISAPSPTVSQPWESIGPGRLDIRRYGDILYVRLPDCQYPGAAGEIARAGQTDFRGIILDLRDNIGGMTKCGGEIAELFIPGQFHGCQKWTRQAKGIDIACGSQFAGMDRRELAALGDPEEALRCIETMNGRGFETYRDTYGSPGQQAQFRQPCIILISRRTVSAAEDTLAFFRSNRRATVLGEPTSGTTGTPYIVPLGYGSARICSVGYRLLDGTEFIGRGILPDIEIPMTVADWQAGHDVQLQQALALLGG